MNRAVQLEAYLDDLDQKEFRWDSFNCCHFASRWVERTIGLDPMNGLPVTPSRMKANRLIKDLGGSLEAAWTKQLGKAPIDPLLAQVGDIAVFPSRDGTGGVGICVGSEAVLINQTGQPIRLSMKHATSAWRI